MDDNITVQDYEEAIDRFVKELEVSPEIVSAFLYGSVARGQTRPGKSDLMDAYVFLSDDVFEDRARFVKVLELFANQCRWLASSGLPFLHPFHYYSEAETGRLPFGFISTLQSHGSTRVLTGKDLRADLDSNSATRFPLRTSPFLGICVDPALTLERFLDGVLDEEAMRQAVGTAARVCKYLPLTVCLAIDRDVPDTEQAAVMASEFPDLDFTLLGRVAALRDDPQPDRVQAFLVEVLDLIEALRDRLAERWRREWFNEDANPGSVDAGA